MLTVADTAFAIATIRAEENERPERERLFTDPYAPIFAAAGAHAREGTDRFLCLPFFRDAIRLRTRFIDDFVREGLAAGAPSVVVLGAGFDMRALRLSEIAAREVKVYEVDFAEQLEAKRAVLEAAGVKLPAWVRHVACDFKAPGFEDELARSLDVKGALFVWEGVVAYLDDEAIDRTLRFVARTGQGSRLVFDAAAGRFAELEALARQAGFSRVESVPLDEAWKRYLPGGPHENAGLAGLYALFV